MFVNQITYFFLKKIAINILFMIKENLPKDLYELQVKEDLNTKYIISFFDLLHNNFDLDESKILIYKQYN